MAQSSSVAAAATSDGIGSRRQVVTRHNPQRDGCLLGRVSGAAGVKCELCMGLAPCGAGAEPGTANTGVGRASTPVAALLGVC